MGRGEAQYRQSSLQEYEKQNCRTQRKLAAQFNKTRQIKTGWLAKRVAEQKNESPERCDRNGGYGRKENAKARDGPPARPRSKVSCAWLGTPLAVPAAVVIFVAVLAGQPAAVGHEGELRLVRR